MMIKQAKFCKLCLKATIIQANKLLTFKLYFVLNAPLTFQKKSKILVQITDFYFIKKYSLKFFLINIILRNFNFFQYFLANNHLNHRLEILEMIHTIKIYISFSIIQNQKKSFFFHMQICHFFFYIKKVALTVFFYLN